MGQLGSDDLGLGPRPEDPTQTPSYVEIELIASHDPIQPGQRFLVAVRLDVLQGWYLYSPEPGSTDEFPVPPAELIVETQGLTHEATLWPKDKAKSIDIAGQTFRNFIYEGRQFAFLRLRASSEESQAPARLKVRLTGQVCSEGGQCVPLSRGPNLQQEISLPLAPQSQPAPRWEEIENVDALVAQAKTPQQLARAHQAQAPEAPILIGGVGDLTLLGAFALALLVGLTLNIMPCVLPIIPLRIYSIVNMAGESRKRVVALGLAFAFGILLFFLALAAVNAGISLTTGQALDWSEMWKFPLARAMVVVILVIVAANMFGLFTVAVPKKVAQIEARSDTRSGGLTSSVGMGLMMAILSTPCSFGPLLGVLTWAQGQPLTQATLVFVFMGLGMALPHALLVAYPKLLEKIPKPGVWMEHFKQAMGFVILLVGAYFLHTLSTAGYAGWVAAFAVILSMGLWVWDKWVRYTDPIRKKFLVRGTTVAILVAAGIWMLRPPRPGGGVQFLNYDPALLAEARSSDRPVLLKFTASWCIVCKEIEANVYDSKQVAQRLEKYNVLPIKVDVSDDGSPGDRFMQERFGRGDPPLSVLIPGNGSPSVHLLGNFKAEDLFAAIDQAGLRVPEDPREPQPPSAPPALGASEP
jgi:thiol:disulfide interchange protein